MKSVFEKFVSRTTDAVAADDRFLGLAISGSWVRDEIDEFSDLDLLVVCEEDTALDLAVMRNFADSLGLLISSFSGEHVGEPRLLICLFDAEPVIHVDIKFMTLSGLKTRSYNSVVVYERESTISTLYKSSEPTPFKPDPQWIEDRFWTWIHYAALRIGRSELFDLVSFLGFIREKVLGPLALHAAGFPPFGVRRIERYLPEFSRQLEETIPAYDVESCYSATLASIKIYRELRASASDAIIVNERAENASVQYLGEVALRVHNLV